MADNNSLIVCGGGAVGKSAITIMYMQGDFLDFYDPTIQDSYKKADTVDNQSTFLEITDTAGQEEYYALQDEFMRNGEGFLLVYSITERLSFDNVKKFHQQILRVKNRDDVPIVLFGNKSDMENERQVATVEGKNLAQQWGARFIEGSAKENKNIKEAFHALVVDVRKHKVQLEKERTQKNKKTKSKKAKKSNFLVSSGAADKQSDLAAFNNI
jgi:GTPase KRas protein